MTPATTSASVTGVSSTANGSAPGRRTASRDFSSHSTRLPGILRDQRDIRIDGGGLDAGGAQVGEPALQYAARHHRDRRTAAGPAPPSAKNSWSTSSVSCSSSAKGTARASLTPLPGGSSGSAKQNLRRGREHDDLAVARHRGGQAQGPALLRGGSVRRHRRCSATRYLLGRARGGEAVVCAACVLKRSERAQQRRHLTAAVSVAEQKTVQGELRSAKRDAGRQPEIRALCPSTMGSRRDSCAQDVAERRISGKQPVLRPLTSTSGLPDYSPFKLSARLSSTSAGAVQRLILAIGGRQRGDVGRDLAVAVRAEAGHVHELARAHHGPFPGAIGRGLAGIDRILRAVGAARMIVRVDPVARDAGPLGLEADGNQAAAEIAPAAMDPVPAGRSEPVTCGEDCSD